jgi:hypothetical protein
VKEASLKMAYPAYCRILILALCLLSARAFAQIPEQENSQMLGKAAHQVMRPQMEACKGTNLECANAATPFLTNDGQLFLIWTAGGAVSVSRSTDLGKTFSTPVEIANHQKKLDVGSDARPQITVDPKGDIFIAYAFFKDSNWNAQINSARSVDGGKTFTAAQPLIQGGASERFPVLDTDAKGTIHLAWIDKRVVQTANKQGNKKLGGSIAYASSSDGGVRFQSETIVNQESCECCRIGMALNPQQFPVLAYRGIFPGGVRDQATQVLSFKQNTSEALPTKANEGIGPIQRLAIDHWKTDVCPHHGPAIAITDTGTTHVAWFTQGSVRQGVFYANSNNEGKTYSPPRQLGNANRNVARPYLLTSGKEVWLAWKEFDGVKAIIYLQHSNDDGKTWSAAKPIAEAVGYTDHPLLIHQGKQVFLSWLTRAKGYQLLSIGQAE